MLERGADVSLDISPVVRERAGVRESEGLVLA